MDMSSKDMSRAKYKLSQSRKRFHKGRQHSSPMTTAWQTKPSDSDDPYAAQASREYVVSDEDEIIDGEDFGKLLAGATQYYGDYELRQSAMLEALLAPQPTPAHIDISQVQLDAGLLDENVKMIPMYQVSGIHPKFSQETYHDLPLSVPTECMNRECTSSEPAQTSEQNANPASVSPPPTPGATHVTTPPKNPTEAPSNPVRAPTTTARPAVAATKAVQRERAGPSTAATAGGESASDVLDGLDDLLAASSPGGRGKIPSGQHSRSDTSAAHASSTLRNKGRVFQQATNQRPANARDAKKALEDWLDL